MSKKQKKSLSRGRPQINDKALIKYEVRSIDCNGEGIVYKFDKTKNKNGTLSVEVFSKTPYPEIKVNVKQKYMGDSPVVMVWKTKRKNAKPKMKVWKTKNIDDVLNNKQAGIPEDAIILELGVGSRLIEIYKAQYSL